MNDDRALMHEQYFFLVKFAPDKLIRPILVYIGLMVPVWPKTKDPGTHKRGERTNRLR